MSERAVGVDTFGWPAARLGECLEVTARAGGLAPHGKEVGAPPAPVQADTDALGRWLDAAATGIGVEAEPVQTRFPEAGRLLAAGGPAILQLPGMPARFVALIGARGKKLRLAVPDGGVVSVPAEDVRAALCEHLEAKATDVDQILDAARVPAARRVRARHAILDQRLAQERLAGVWIQRLPPGASFWAQLRQSGLTTAVRTFILAQLVQYVLVLGGWWMIGQGALSGHLDRGWLTAWALMLLSYIVFRQRSTWAQGILAIGAGALLKRRLLHGVLRLAPDEIRHQGIGQLIGRVVESEAVESLVLGGGGLAIEAVCELTLAPIILASGAGGGWHALLLLVWIGLTLAIARAYYVRRRTWTGARVGMTHDLVERMVGHRTRVAQEARSRWQDGVDHAVERFLAVSRDMDSATRKLLAVAPRGWLVIGLLALVPAFMSGGGATHAAARLAISLGGLLFAYRALVKLAQGVSTLADAAIAWRQVAELYHAAARPIAVGSAALVAPPVARGEPLLSAHELTFRYPGRSEAVLDALRLEIVAGERLLLEGPSGGGKSTLASLLIGLRAPEHGLLLCGGLDRASLGEGGWRRRIIAAPQFHENHVLCETFAFNLLMGRGWPPSNADLKEARTICEELGLGSLLTRMPAGLFQTVGESGWQLSHGEKSRVYIARALLQHAELVILDESFAALDPETLDRALRCVERRAGTLLVIAHP